MPFKPVTDKYFKTAHAVRRANLFFAQPQLMTLNVKDAY